MTEQKTDVETLTEAAEKAQKELAAAKLLEDQRKNLLPKLEMKATKLHERIQPLQDEKECLITAIQSIRGGTPTDYRLRKPPTRKAKAGA